MSPEAATPDGTPAERSPTLADVRAAAAVAAEVARVTPVLSTRTISEAAGTTVVLKAENLQRTGSFKLRGALAKIAALERSGQPPRGVVCGSAGNHAQAVAYAARARGIPCEVFMPDGAPIAKTEAATALGATVRLGGASVDDAVAAAQARADAAEMAFIHPFDDPDVISGQGGVGLELLEQVPDLARVVVPIGGGGLISGIAVAIRSQRPGVEIVGVQVEACAAVGPSLAAGVPVPVTAPQSTIADGIAVKRPGERTLALIQRWVDEVLVVGEDQVAEAMVLLLERAKLVVEGAGAVGVAAALDGRLPPRSGATALVLSGGNVDAGLLAQITRRHETQAGRRLVLEAHLPDRPGALAGLLGTVAGTGANLLDVRHIREGLDLHVRETVVALVLETRGPEHAATVTAALAAAGYR
ncbi:threonine ammonia-lyase [Conexibacter sp. DBS9H8]|uniref:threonine ammonia-lyase n=1 Tax=Conexibacter sp. DBS9H8 TaxID=2937801 RepID=UPI0020102222|nr:threonine ammonia-lyase [Conexibacter sp. DBS9H8]